jgi:hypothetical protein
MHISYEKQFLQESCHSNYQWYCSSHSKLTQGGRKGKGGVAGMGDVGKDRMLGRNEFEAVLEDRENFNFNLRKSLFTPLGVLAPTYNIGILNGRNLFPDIVLAR